MIHWKSEELETLRRLRERFLTETAGDSDYWRSAGDLSLYDATFGERIGWKWDAVLRELVLREWRPQSRHVVDWGCGSGIAGRRVLACWPKVESLALHDRSPLARTFAAEKARTAFPPARVEKFETLRPDTLLLVSHVINELLPGALTRLLEVASQAREIIWVEAGTHADSRRLIEVRERLVSMGLNVLAPCTHQARCGLLTVANSRHWCHHFATPPSAVFQDARWAQFGRELGIDLRSLPYSFLVLTRDPTPLPGGFSRIIGVPRDSKGYSKVLSCHAAGVAELMLQKRDAPELLREVRNGPEVAVYRWTIEAGRITVGEPLVPRD